MGRREDRLLKKMKGENLRSANADPDPSRMLNPFMVGDTRVIPVQVDNEKKAAGPVMPRDYSDEEDGMTLEQFRHITQDLSDKELNRIIYQNAKMAVADGVMPPFPEDDYGTVMWFAWNFITPEMREAFPAIAKEYLKHYRSAEENSNVPAAFLDIPYPRMNEATWEDAYNFRVLLMMLFSARAGSSYSRNFLISLYKVYYKPEYNKVKKLDVLTYLDILELLDEDCLRKGLGSGHTVDGKMSFREKEIEKRRHEPGWTNVYGDRALSPVPGKRRKEGLNADVLNKAAAEIADIYDSPDEPPLQPAAARLLVVCRLLGKEIDSTCNEVAVHMNVISDNMAALIFLNSPEYRKLRNEMVERCKGLLRADYPEMFDPYDYQRDENYLGLQVAEQVMSDVFKKYDTNVRMPYDSKKFVLADLMADLTISLQMNFPQARFSFDEVLMLSMVQYLAECMCEVMEERDAELDEILKFKRRKGKGEWDREDEQIRDDRLAEKVLRNVESLRGKDQESTDPLEEASAGAADELDETGLRKEIENLQRRLAEKEAALAEEEQKTIRQRVLYEKEREKRRELEQAADDAEVEHAELIALREFVYGLKEGMQQEDDLDEETREKLIARVRNRKVAVLGGTERWIKRMKRILPEWSYIAVDDMGIGSFHALERADFIYIYTSALKHAQYYRAMNLVKRQGKMLYYLGSGNIDECLRQFAKELGSAALSG